MFLSARRFGVILSDGVVSARLEMTVVLQLVDETVNGHDLVLGIRVRMALASLASSDRLRDEQRKVIMYYV